MSDDEPRQPASGLPFLPPVDPARAGTGAEVTPEALAAFLTDGDEEVARWALRRALLGAPRALVYDTLVRGAMELVGDRWVSGRWTVSEEHLASRTLGRVLTSLAPPESPADRLLPVAVLAGVAGEEHAIGLILLEHVLREAGFATADLGADVPVGDLVRFATKFGARLVALTASTIDRDEALRDTIAALQAVPVPPAVIVGGRIAALTSLSGTGVDWVGTSLVEASRFARDLAGRIERETQPG